MADASIHLEGEVEYQNQLGNEAKKYADEKIAEQKAKGSPIPQESLKDKYVQEYLKEMEMLAVQEHFSTCIHHFLEEGGRYLEPDQKKASEENIRTMIKLLPSIDLSSVTEETSIREVLKITDATCDAFETVGRNRFQEEDYITAIAYYFILTLLKPECQIYWKRLGICYHGAEYFEEAEIAYTNVLETEPGDISTLLFLSDCCIHLDQHEMANEYLLRATKEIQDKQVEEEWSAYSEVLRKAL